MRFTNRFGDVAIGAATTAFLGAGVILAGWVLGLPALTTYGQRWTPMVASTAMSIMLCAVAAIIMGRAGTPHRWRSVRAMGGVVALHAMIILANYTSIWVRDVSLFATGPAWRMASNTAFAFALLGSALTLTGGSQAARRAAELLAAATLLIAAVLLLAFLFGATTLSELMGHVNMSPLTGLGLLLVAVSVLLLIPHGWFVGVVTATGTGSRLARRLLPFAVIAPVILGSLRLEAQRRGVLDLEYGVALNVLVTIVGIAVAVLWAAEQVNRGEASLRALAAELEDRVAQRTMELKVANRELESFAYSVSHDLRTPLRALDGFSQAVIEDYADRLDDTGRDYLQRIRRGSQRMGDLIDALLDLSRVSRGELQQERVDLSAMAAEIAASLRERAPERKVSIAIEPGLVAQGDPRLLRALLQNLLANAWKFTGRSRDARIEFARHADNGRSCFFVRDNGAGFDMTFASKLFGAFQRLHDAKEFEGTGVGLATAQRIVHRHGGEIWAEGAPQKGASFYFTLTHTPGGAPLEKDIGAVGRG